MAALIKCRMVWRALPLFTASVFLTAVFEFSYQPYSSAWLKKWYVWLIWPVLIARAGAVYEAFVVHSEGSPVRRSAAITAVAIALICGGMVAWNLTGNVIPAAQWRRVAMISMTAFLAVYVLALWASGEWRGGIAGRHVLLLLAICLSLTIPALLNMAFPKEKWLWWTVDPIAYGTRALIYFTWCLSISIPDRKPDSQAKLTAA